MSARRPRPNYGTTSEHSIAKSTVAIEDGRLARTVKDADATEDAALEPATTVGDSRLPTLASAPAPRSAIRRRLDGAWTLVRKQCVGVWVLGRPSTRPFARAALTLLIIRYLGPGIVASVAYLDPGASAVFRDAI